MSLSLQTFPLLGSLTRADVGLLVLSGLLHLGGLVVLDAWNLDGKYEAEPVGLQTAVSLEGTIVKPQPLAANVVQLEIERPVEPIVTDDVAQLFDPVLIKPEEAQIADQRFVRISSKVTLPADSPRTERLAESGDPVAAVDSEPAKRQENPPKVEKSDDAQQMARRATPPPQPAVVSASVPQEPQRAGENRLLARPIYKPLPVYPAQARLNGLEGVVLLELTVSSAGEVTQVEVIRSSGHSILDGSAYNLARRWRFETASRDWKVRLPYRFEL